MSGVMPDDDDKNRREFEEARKEFDDDPPPQAKKPAGDAAEPQGENGRGQQRPSLRIVTLPRPEPWAAPAWQPTGEAVVMEMKRKYESDFYHVPLEGMTYHWNGHLWVLDETSQAMRLGAQLCREIGAVKKKGVRKEIEKASFVRGVVSRFRDEVSGPFNRFDSAEVLCTPTETIPLSLDKSVALEPREHRREDYCTRACAVSAIRGPCPMWLAFLDQVTASDSDLREYIKRCCGYWLSPYTSEQQLWFLHGTGGNGKGALCRTVKRVLGSYVSTASLDLFLATKFEQHTEELAALRGVRLVFASETEKGRSWNETKIKAITGGDAIRARFMRQNSFEYMPQFKPVIPGNHKPVIKSVDAAMRRRLNLIPFVVEIPKAQQDDAFEMRMFKAEGPAILAWMLDGFQDWRSEGMCPPDCVLAASEEYFAEEDILGQWFVADCDTSDPGFFGYTRALFPVWDKWCKARGVHPKVIGNEISFARELAKRFRHEHKRDGNGFWGIKLKPVEEREDYQDGERAEDFR